MPTIDERTIALAYDDAEAMLHSGMLDQNVIGTLASRGLDWETAKHIVTDLNGTQAQRPKRKYKPDNPKARHAASELMIRGLILIATGIIVFLIGITLVPPTAAPFVFFVSILPLYSGIWQFSKGLIIRFMGDDPLFRRSAQRSRFRRW